MAENCKTNSDQIRVECRGADSLPIDAIEEFQGSLKKRTKKEIDQIVKSITTYGFSFPFFVWQFEGHNYCLDGHGRIAALCELRRRGVNLPLFPVAYVEAVDEAEAKQKLLRLNSQYGSMTINSVLEFTDGMSVEWEDLALPKGTLEIKPEEDPIQKNSSKGFFLRLRTSASMSWLKTAPYLLQPHKVESLA